jgi:transcriptional regulator with XRE-family HTH domain
MFSGSKLRINRQRVGKTQESLARELGITGAYLSNIENDKRKPSMKVMEAAAQALSIPIAPLWEDDGTLPPVPIKDAEKGIVIEHGEGVDKVRYILPPTSEASAIISQDIKTWMNNIDPGLAKIVRLWKKSNDEDKALIITAISDIFPDFNS